MTRRVLVVIGTRPEAIKMLPVVRALRAAPGLATTVLTTGQHRAMLDQVFASFGERPDADLSIMAPGQSLADITTRVLQAMPERFERHRPDLVLVHGDTTTAMAAALASFYAGIPVGHVEAGLRSHDMTRPFPEEFNRTAIDAVASLLFAPTEGAAANLARETPRPRRIVVTGNTAIDALLHVAAGLRGDELDHLGIPWDDDRRLVLVTGHRRESFGEGFERICEGLLRISRRADVRIVYPLHLNPRVRGPVLERIGGLEALHLIDPVEYPQMVALMQRAHLILTDSGGIQEEAPALGKPVLVMRDVTERPEAIACGTASLVGTDPDLIAREADRLLDDGDHYAARARKMFPFGDGRAAGRIVAECIEYMRQG